MVANGGGLVIRASYGWGEPWLGRLHAMLPWLDRAATPPATERVLGSVSLIDGAQ